jgi:hypothetical protein
MSRKANRRIMVAVTAACGAISSSAYLYSSWANSLGGAG